MTASLRSLTFAALLACFAAPSFGQQAPPTHEPYTYERSVVESVVGTVVKVIQEATLQGSDDRISAELRAMAQRLSGTRSSFVPAAVGANARPSDIAAEDLAELQEALEALYAEVRALRQELEAEEKGVAGRLLSVEVHVKDALDLTERLTEDGRAADEREPLMAEAEDEWVEELERSLDDTSSAPFASRRDEANDGWHFEWGSDDQDDWSRDNDWEREERRQGRPGFVRHGRAASLFGTIPQRWPFPETALYNTPPAIRHNRVEGFVLGIAEESLRLGESRRTKLYGQVGRAFGLDRWRYEIGGELRLNREEHERSGLKVGASYRYNTVTEDVWKSNWVENTLAAFLFRNDFFDYYQAEGFSVYGVQRFSPVLQVSAGFRSEEHSSLSRTTDWSLFKADTPRENPFVDDGAVRSFVGAIEGGRVTNLNYLPQGFAFRLEAEVDPNLGDRQFSRFTADGRLYLPVARRSNLALRLRGGFSTGEVPFQKVFRLGGVGSMRGYPQNFVFGEQMLLGNAEFTVAGPRFFDEAFEDLMLFGFADAGYAGAAERSGLFSTGDLFPSAGFGVALDERNLRLELAFPLKDAGFGMAPSLWFRLSPTF